MIIRKVIRKISEHRISKFIIILEQGLRSRKRSKIKTKKIYEFSCAVQYRYNIVFLCKR